MLSSTSDAELYYRFTLRAPYGHLLLGLILLGTLWFFLPKVWRKMSAERFASLGTVESLRRAIALEPDRAEYRNQLGGLYLYSLAAYDPKQARASYMRATQLNPAVASYWLGLAQADQLEGRSAEAIQCVEAARRRDPRNPELAAAMGQIRASAGRVNEALESWRESVEGQPTNLPQMLDQGWKLVPNTQVLLDHLVPPDNADDFAFMDFLMRNHAGDPTLVWKRIVARGQPMNPARAKNYLDMLLGFDPDPAAWRQHVLFAHQAWADVLRLREPSGDEGEDPHANQVQPASGNLIYNGSFEQEMTNSGFDWRWDGRPGVSLMFDSTIAQQGRRSLRLDFDGMENLQSMMPSELLVLEPQHHYLLTAYVRADRIQSSTGPKLSVGTWDAKGNPVVLAESEEIFHTSSWQEQRLSFVMPHDAILARVMVLREISHKISPKIAGTFWMDNLTLRDVGPAPRS